MADHLGFYCLFAFVIQFAVCFARAKLWIRTLPMISILAFMGVSMLRFFFNGEVYSLLYYMGWGAVLFCGGAAWILFALVKIFIEERK